MKGRTRGQFMTLGSNPMGFSQQTTRSKLTADFITRFTNTFAERLLLIIFFLMKYRAMGWELPFY